MDIIINKYVVTYWIVYIAKIKKDMMKKAIFLLVLVAILSACTIHRNMVRLQSSGVVTKKDVSLASFRHYRDSTIRQWTLEGMWQRPNVTLDLKSNGRYYYHYKEDDYNNKQSGKYRYFADKDSVVLYNFYPQAYTAESKNLRWSIRRLTADSLVVYVHKPTVILDGDTLNTIGDTFETFTRK